MMQGRYTRYRLTALLFIAVTTNNICLYAQTVAPAIEWAKCYGGTQLDVANSITRTANDGVMVGGSAVSSDGDVTGKHSMAGDAWLLQIDKLGNITDKKCYGGTDADGVAHVELTSDGGYIMSGGTNSTDGDVSGFHGGFASDAWVAKLSVGGSVIWQRCLGGTEEDAAMCVQQTSGGGYVMAGYTYSSDGDVSGFHGGNPDGWVVKLDDTGHIEWQHALGGTGVDYLYSIVQTADSGYLAVGYTSSNDGDVSGVHLNASSFPSEDVWLVKLNKDGSMAWQKCLGGSQQDHGNAIKSTNDGNYIIAGWTTSFDGDVSGSHTSASLADYWIIKVDGTGHILWEKCYGGNNSEFALDIAPTYDGGYIIGGSASSTDGDVTGLRGDADFWAVKINGAGALQWQKCMGGTNMEIANSIMQTIDSGYVIAGWTISRNYDVSGYHDKDSSTFDGDYWVVKLGKDPVGVATVSIASNIAVYPNPSSGLFLVDTEVPKGCSAAVYNMMGSCVYRGILHAGQTKIDLSKEAAGIYFMQLHGSDGSVRTEKLVIEQ